MMDVFLAAVQLRSEGQGFDDFAVRYFLILTCRNNNGWISSAENPTSVHLSVDCNLGGQKANHIS